MVCEKWVGGFLNEMDAVLVLLNKKARNKNAFQTLQQCIHALLADFDGVNRPEKNAGGWRMMMVWQGEKKNKKKRWKSAKIIIYDDDDKT